MTLPDPRRYFESVGARAPRAEALPVCLYLEVTNRCNLLCETCPRTFEALEPPADMRLGSCSPASSIRCPASRASCCTASASRCWCARCRA